MSDENCFDTMEYWLHSLNAKVPESNVILVGTHYDIIKNEKEIPEQFFTKFKQVSKFLISFYFYYSYYFYNFIFITLFFSLSLFLLIL